MRTYEGFLLGVIAGAAVVWCWRRELEACARDKTRRVRARAAEGTEEALARGGNPLRRAEEALQDTRGQVGEALRTGEDAIRPTAPPRGA